MRGHVVRALGSTEEKADIIGPHKWPGFVGEGKETLAYGRAAATSAGVNSGLTLHAAIGSVSVAPAGGAPGVCRSARCAGYWSPLWRSKTPLRDQPLDDGRRVQPSCAADVSRTGEAGSDAPPVSGGAMSAMRAHAVAATAIAPITAIACRQPSAGMPICARPSAA